uniref:Uncharacterized protein n=1 Tax=Timema monikensis TaxID=170555 RepID=A0A7R9E9F4_9NEOP|nr:unnamed protein product [Timema monikensis]
MKSLSVCHEYSMLSDVYFLYSLFLTVKLQLKHTDSPVYAYQYDHKRPPQLDKLIPDFTKNVPGMFSSTALARYTRGLPYPCPKTSLQILPTETEGLHNPGVQVQHTYTHESVPQKTDSNSSNITQPQFTAQVLTDPNSSDFQVKWPQLTRDSFDFLNISPELTLLKDFAKDRMDFWEEIYLASKK